MAPNFCGLAGVSQHITSFVGSYKSIDFGGLFVRNILQCFTVQYSA
jgi:hypothetical protein